MQAYVKYVAALAFAAAGQMAPAFATTELAGCAARREVVQNRINDAQGDPERMAGLEKSLDEINAHCKDSSLSKQRNRKIIEAQNEVNEAGQALHRAESEQASEKKIEKLRAKLERAKAKLSDAEAELKR
jgi:hypothetical protein